MTPEDLPDVVELGFSIQKIGESAAVALDSFSLEGRKRGNLRRSWRKTGECGACFEVVPVGVPPGLYEELQAVSDQWLAHHAGGEKTFSLGGFEPAYIAEFPIAVVRVDGDVVWTGLEVTDTVAGGLHDETGEVEFTASFTDGVMHERSRFERRAGRWLYVDGDVE